jgi:SAM-dependent methyltransferase|tara:strand:- start:2230 stop:3084 length:855 start_codon:yes stop_codon:yes gene_type:complete
MKTHNKHITLKDYSVSGQTFELLTDPSLGLLYTHPKPGDEQLKAYYPQEGYISHSNQLKSFFDFLYHAVRYFSLRKKVRFIKPFKSKAGALLDVGAGTGSFIRAAKRSGWDVKGIEPDSVARGIANTKNANTVFSLKTLSSLKTASYDVITLWHVLEHLPNLQEDLKTFKRLLKPNGRIIVAVPNFNSFDAIYFKGFWAAYDVPRHLWHFSQDSIPKVFSEVQMTLESTHPMRMDAYYVSMLSNKHKTGSIRFLSSLKIGCRSNLQASKTGEYSSLIYVLKNTD